MLSIPPIQFEGQNKTVTQLYDDLAVGSFVHAPELIKQGWVCILLTNAAPEPPLPSVKVVLIDGSGNDKQRLQSVICWIVSRWAEGKKVAVMCRHGANRAPSAAASAMYVAGRASSIYTTLEWMRGQRKEVGRYSNVTSEFEAAAADMVKITMKEGSCAAA